MNIEPLGLNSIVIRLRWANLIIDENINDETTIYIYRNPTIKTNFDDKTQQIIHISKNEQLKTPN